jgi:hypothetical protein
MASEQLGHMTEIDASIQESRPAVRRKKKETSMIRLDRVEMQYRPN